MLVDPFTRLSETRGSRDDVEEDVRLEKSWCSPISYDVAGRWLCFEAFSSARRILLRLNQPLDFSFGDFSCPLTDGGAGKVVVVELEVSLSSLVIFGEVTGSKGGTGGAEVDAFMEIRLLDPTLGFDGL